MTRGGAGSRFGPQLRLLPRRSDRISHRDRAAVDAGPMPARHRITQRPYQRVSASRRDFDDGLAAILPAARAARKTRGFKFRKHACERLRLQIMGRGQIPDGLRTAVVQFAEHAQLVPAEAVRRALDKQPAGALKNSSSNLSGRSAQQVKRRWAVERSLSHRHYNVTPGADARTCSNGSLNGRHGIKIMRSIIMERDVAVTTRDRLLAICLSPR